jgi:hypothetical protein
MILFCIIVAGGTMCFTPGKQCCPIFRDTIPLITILSMYSCLLVTANDLIGSTISCVSSGSIPGTYRQQRYHPPDPDICFFFFLRMRIVDFGPHCTEIQFMYYRKRNCV